MTSKFDWANEEKYTDILNSDEFRLRASRIIYGETIGRDNRACLAFAIGTCIFGLLLLAEGVINAENDFKTGFLILGGLLLVVIGIFGGCTGFKNAEDFVKEVSDGALARDIAANEENLHRLAERMYRESHQNDLPPADTGIDKIEAAISGEDQWTKIQIERAANDAVRNTADKPGH